mgnify:CR=1 FL=1
MGDSYKVGQKIDYTTEDGEEIQLTVETVNPNTKKKYIVSGQKKIDGKVSPSSPVFIARLSSLNEDTWKEEANSIDDQIKEQKGKHMEEIKKMAREMGIKIGKYKIEGGRRTRRRKRKRRRTRKKKRRRRSKKKRRRRRRKTRK